MSTDHPADPIDYVRAAAALLGLPLDDAQAARVARHLARTRTMAALLRDLPLLAADEPAEIYCPAPFPTEGPR
jgi:Protein of unknown function (DUF4089)